MTDMKADQPITLTITAAELQTVIRALGEMPYAQVANLIPNLVQQAHHQPASEAEGLKVVANE